ncbi:MAG: HD domain-containing protein [Gemmatimonadota bacterium]|nr:HD domain-containing protein [Gemmatimonadota bacterium]
MRIDGVRLRSRLTRRILTLFALCAVAPIAVTITVTYWQTERRMSVEHRERLRRESKLAGEQVLERVRLLEREFERVVRAVSLGMTEGGVATADSIDSRLGGLAFERGLGETETVFGAPQAPPPLPSLIRDRLDDGETVLATLPAADGQSSLLLIRQVRLDGTRRLIWGEIDTDRLGDETTAFSASTDLCLLDSTRRPIFCPTEIPEGVLPVPGTPRNTASEAYLDWGDDESRWVGAYSLVFIAFDFAGPPWMVVASEPASRSAANIADYRLSMILGGVIGLGTVILFSSIQLRRSLEALNRLKSGTRRVSDGDFTARVHVESRDELGDLASSFNDMTGRLQGQFETLEALRHIGRSVLTTPDADRIAAVTLKETVCLAHCDAAALLMISDAASGEAVAYGHVAGTEGSEAVWRVDAAKLTDEDELLLRGNGLLELDDGRVLSSIPSELEIQPDRYRVAAALEHQKVLHGLLVLSFESSEAASEAASRPEIYQLVDQVAVALGNVRLVSQLENMRIGALTALAKTVDAKSRWTAGHSERVTRVVYALGEELGGDEKDLELLERAGLLHDIGKLGVPESILDSPDPLSPEERAEIEKHPEIGAAILSPIAAFADVIPAVMYHHERWDGSGYPEGLSGEAIPYTARVMAVADVFESLTSDRPYRDPLPLEDAIRFIEQSAGSHFDPRIVPYLRPALVRAGELVDEEPPVRAMAVGE